MKTSELVLPEIVHHTPGPWHMMETEPGIDAEMDIFVTTPRWAGGKGLIARVVDADDAVLIAAAPDLLAALSKFVDYYGALPDDNGLDERLTNARVAIAKATGGNIK